MIPRPPVERLPLPALPTVAGRSGFPLVATLAPLGVAAALWGITRSPYSLLFALLGPVVALGGLVDSRISRRRTARRELERFRLGLDRLRGRVLGQHEAERDRLDRLAPVALLRADGGEPGSAGAERMLGWRDEAGGSVAVRLGTGSVPSPVMIDGDEPDDAPDDVRAEIADLRSLAAGFDDAPVVLDGCDGVGIVGPAILAVAVARSLVLQLAARFSPESTVVTVPPGEHAWAEALPHAVAVAEGNAMRLSGTSDLVVAWSTETSSLPLECGVVASLDGVRGEAVSELRLLAVSRQRARRAAESLLNAAEAHGLRPASELLADRVELADLLAEVGTAPRDARGLAAPVARDAHGPVCLDLVADGPHALVAGTTGSGKSELLVSWVLAIAARYPPELVTFLLIDFKGGAAFAPLAGVPHVVATLSDLDRRLTRRAIESLRAELLHRERTLAGHAARSIDELPQGVLARLVIVVDEFAAVVADSPELHEVFTDLAARGRSLGLHLVLCTQRPSGVVRDAVLANVTIRVSLRVTDRGDSTAMVGSDAASRLPVDPRGRAIIADGHSSREVQLAIAGRADADRVRATSAPSELARPWCDPLPSHIELESLHARPSDSPPSGYVFGLADLPAERRQPAAAHDPVAHGHLLVVGAGASGKSTALAAIAASAARAGVAVRRLPSDAADAWGALCLSPAERGLLLIDDLDLLVARFDGDYRHEVLEMLSRLAREGSALGVGLVASAQRLTGPLASIGGLFGSRLLLRMASREEHVLAGGDGPQFDPDLPAGAGRWRGAVVQVAVPATGATATGASASATESDGSEPAAAPLPAVRIGDHAVLALVAARPRGLAERLRAAGARVVELGASPFDAERLLATGGGAPTVLLGDPDAWNADWSALTLARRELPIVLLGCTPADHRVLLRDRELPPLLGSAPGECWLADGGRTVRALLHLDPSEAALT